jgi:hypothetical protein
VTGQVKPADDGAGQAREGGMKQRFIPSFLLRLCAPLWLKILQCFGKFQPLKSK